jgi:hypothetical protein
MNDATIVGICTASTLSPGVVAVRCKLLPLYPPRLKLLAGFGVVLSHHISLGYYSRAFI